MKFTAKQNNHNNNNRTEGWGMGFFLVFFPAEQNPNHPNPNLKPQKNVFSSSSCKPIIPTTFNSLLRRTNSSHLLTKAQSTISICALLVFISLLLFTVSTFEPTTNNYSPSRKQLSFIKLPQKSNTHYNKSSISHALQGMGTLYTRGTRAMNDLIICHVSESVTADELRLFLRLVHRSSLTSRSDLLFIFPSSSLSFDSAIREENESVLKLITRFSELNGTAGVHSDANFDVTQFVKSRKKEKESAEPIWGRRIRGNYGGGDNGTELPRLSYGSVVGFEVDELDPENALAGFLDHVPMNLRRWACYTMLLGRTRRNFRHVMLVDVKDVFLLGDPLSRVKNRTPESVYLSTLAPVKHGRKTSDKTQSTRQKLVDSSVIIGGARGVRRLAKSMLTEIVRTALQHKRKNSVTESGVLNQLVENEFLLKDIKLIISSESTQEASSLNSAALLSKLNHTVLRRGSSNKDFHAIIMKHICSFTLDSSVYSDC